MGVSLPVANRSKRTEFAVLIGRVRKLKPLFREAARDTENNRRVSKRAMDLLDDAEIMRMLRPAAFGGFEYGTSEAARIAFEIGQACGSTAWCASLAMSYQWMGSFFPLEAQRELWSDPDRCMIAAVFNPSRAVELAPGGVKLAGEWLYASNCDNADWLILGALVPNASGAPEAMWALVPATMAVIKQSTWFTSGLQGSGSKTVVIKTPVFVPDHRLLRFSDILAGTVPGKAIEGNVMAHIRFMPFGPTGLVAPILGMAQGALEAFTQTCQTRVRAIKPGMIVPVANSPIIQSKIGAASAAIESACSLLFDSVAAAEEKVRRGGQLSIEERIAIRRNQGFAAKQSVLVVNDLFAKEGAAGSDSTAPLQRFWRDVNAAALHVSLDWEAIAAMYGQQRLGLEPVGLY